MSVLEQRAKIQAVQLSDSNTGYFFAQIKERKHQSIISTIQDHNGVQQHGWEKVNNAFTDYYQSLLGKKTVVAPPLDIDFISGGTKICEVEWHQLIKPITDIKIKDVVFAIDPNKSPGPDGFSSNFFKTSWHIVGKDYCAAIHEFFRTKRMAKQANTTLLALLPKKKVVHSVRDYRPIALCSTIYKTISKILAKRMQFFMPQVVGTEQGAFVHGRSIHENIMLL